MAYSVNDIKKYVRKFGDMHIKEACDPKFQKIPNIVKLYNKISDDKYIIARSYAHGRGLAYDIPNIREHLNHIISNIEMYPYQDNIVNDVIDVISRPPHTYFIHLPTGLGKTRISIKILSLLKVRTLVVTPTVHIAKQWKDTIDLLLPELKTSLIPDSYSDVVILVVNTARNSLGTFDCTILDEVHEYTSKVNKNVMWNAMYSKYIIGLSATPDTSKGLLPFISGCIGEPRKPVGIDTLLPQFEVNVFNIHYYSHGEYIIPVLNCNGDVSTINTIQKIIEDPVRLEVVIKYVRWLLLMEFDIGGKTCTHKVYVFAETRDYLDVISSALEKMGIKSDIEDDMPSEVEILRGGVKKEVLDNIGDKRVILTTYGYSRRGISYKDYTAAILATPRKRADIIEQVIGRILRVDGNNDIPRYVVDIHDANTVLARQNDNHVELYNKQKYNVNDIYVNTKFRWS